MKRKRGNAEGSIYRMKDGRWRAAVTGGKGADGKLKRKVFTAATRHEVADALTRALRDQQQRVNIAPDRVTVQAHMQRWLTDMVKPSCSFKTYTTYRDLAEDHIIPVFGPRLLAKVTTPEIQRFLNEKHEAGLSAKTVKHIRDCFRAALNVAVHDWDLIPKNPASKARPPDQVERPMNVFDTAQARAFLRLVENHRLQALFSLAICLGPRQGEVLGIRWENLSLDSRMLTINGALKRVEGILIKGKTKKTCSNRTIVLPAITVNALRRHQALQNQERTWAGARWKETGYVFTTMIGTPIERRNLLRDWYRLMAGSGLPRIRFHDLRHSAATLLFAQGVHPRTVMEILGHKDLNTTMRIYGHVLDQMKQDAAARMDELLSVDGVATRVATKPASEQVVN
jgi:integrase